MAKHPMQPIVLDDHGVARFKANPIVRFLLDNYKPGLNDIAKREFADDDYQHLMQLIGYSVSGYGDLGVAPKKIVAKADRQVEKLAKRK